MICRIKHSLIQRRHRNFTGKGEFSEHNVGLIFVAKFMVAAVVASASVCFRDQSVIRGLAKTCEVG